jgi:hypothetical protein
MKYWGYFVVKLGAAALVLRLVWAGLYAFLPAPGLVLRQEMRRFGQDLRWTIVILAFWLFSVGLMYLLIWDQHRRCRVCVRRLRMPVEKGSWGRATLFSPPRRESICPYGHGTLQEPEIHEASSEAVEWRKHRGIWEELERVDQGRD